MYARSLLVFRLNASILTNTPPNQVFNASNYSNDTIQLTSGQWAGEFLVVSGFEPGAIYRYIVASDLFITLTDMNDQILASGVSPLEYSANVDTVKVHVNLIFPPCGTNSTPHTVDLFCVTCPESSNVKIGPLVPGDDSAVLSINATQQGVLIPRYATSEKLNIPDPAHGLLVYDVNLRTISMYDNVEKEWRNIMKTAQTKKVTIPAESFNPRNQVNGEASVDNYTDFIYGRYGSFDPNETATIFQAGLQIPVGSVITMIRFFYVDDSASENMTFELVRSSFTILDEAPEASFTSSGKTNSKRVNTQNVNVPILQDYSYFIKAYGGSFFDPNYLAMGIIGAEVTYIEP